MIKKYPLASSPFSVETFHQTKFTVNAIGPTQILAGQVSNVKVKGFSVISKDGSVDYILFSATNIIKEQSNLQRGIQEILPVFGQLVFGASDDYWFEVQATEALNITLSGGALVVSGLIIWSF